MNAKEISKFIKNNNYLGIIVKPNAAENCVLSFDTAHNALKVAIAAPPEKNKANLEIIRFFSKILGKKVQISAGLSSRKKTLRIIE